MTIVGISGKARSGKDTFADFLASQFEENTVIKTAYADELKRQVAEHFDLSYDQLYGCLKEVEDGRYQKPDGSGYWTPREIMQNYGQFMREIDSNYWIKALLRGLEKQMSTPSELNIIIADLRHINEVDSILEHNGIHIRVYRKSAECDSVHNTSHISETALDNYGKVDFEVHNDGTLDDLKERAIEIAKLVVNHPLTSQGA